MQDATGKMQQATGKMLQARCNRQDATGNRQDATGNRQDATGNRQQTRCYRQCAGLYPSGRDLSGDRRLFVCFGCARMSTDLHGCLSQCNACPVEHRSHRGTYCAVHMVRVRRCAESCMRQPLSHRVGAVRCAAVCSVRTIRKQTHNPKPSLGSHCRAETERFRRSVPQCHSGAKPLGLRMRRKDSGVTVCTGWSCRRRCA